MRVALVGSHGSGKTTLAARVAENLGLTYVPEIARDVLNDMGITENLGALPVKKAIEVQREIMRRKEEYIAGRESFLQDRNLVDVYAYSHYWLSRQEEAQDFMAEMVERVREDARNHDLVILVPPLIPVVEDGVRATLPAYRKTIHYLIKGLLLEYYRGQWVELKAVPLKERIKEVEEEIGYSFCNRKVGDRVSFSDIFRNRTRCC